MANKVRHVLLCFLGMLAGTLASMCRVTYKSNTELQCYPCQLGFEHVRDCSDNETQSQCVPCKEGFYQPDCSSVVEGNCQLCSECFIYLQHCTATHDAICNDTKDIDECRDPVLNVCNQICTNTIGSFTCSCWPGYVITDTNDCTNIDECSKECEQICTDTIGGPACSCYPGFALNPDGKTCSGRHQTENSQNSSLGVYSTVAAVAVVIVIITLLLMIRIRRCKTNHEFANPLYSTHESQSGDDTNRGNNTFQRTREEHSSENTSIHKISQDNNDSKDADIDWFKIFKDLIPMLPVEEASWKFFAFDLFHICQQKCGLPKDIHNEVKKIEHSNKGVGLAYHEVFYTWYRLMATDAALEHLEVSLQRFENAFIMEEFNRIKNDPPIRIQCPQQTDIARSLLDRPDIYMQQSSLFACAQQDNFTERDETLKYRLHNMREQQFIQFTHVSNTAPPKISMTTLSPPLTPCFRGRRFKDNSSYQKIRNDHTKLKHKVWQEKQKVKKNLKTAVQMSYLVEQNYKLKNENIILIKKILPFNQILLSRQEYNTFLDHTVDVIMEHNNVTKEAVLSLAFKAYQEIAETKNGGRFILHSGATNIKLDKDQYECLDFYVKHARARVLKELTELKEHGDTSFLFITYDGKSALQTYKTKHSSMRKMTNASRMLDAAHSSSCDGDELLPLPNSSDDIEIENDVSNKPTAYATTSCDTNVCEKMFQSINKQSRTGKSIAKQEYDCSVDDSQSDAIEEKAVVKRLSETEHLKVVNETAAFCDASCNDIDHLEMAGRESRYLNTDKPLEDFLKEIDKELESSTYV